MKWNEIPTEDDSDEEVCEDKPDEDGEGDHEGVHHIATAAVERQTSGLVAEPAVGGVVGRVNHTTGNLATKSTDE